MPYNAECVSQTGDIFSGQTCLGGSLTPGDSEVASALTGIHLSDALPLLLRAGPKTEAAIGIAGFL